MFEIASLIISAYIVTVLFITIWIVLCEVKKK